MAQAKQSAEKRSTSAKWDTQLGPVNTTYYCFFISLGNKGCVSQQQFYHDKQQSDSMAWQLIPSTRSGCTKAGQMEAVPQSTFSGVSVLTHSSACSFLSDCSGTALTPPVSCFFPAASLVVFQELSCCPHVSPPPLGRCIIYRSNRLLRCCPFDLMRETPTAMMCMCFFPHYLARGTEYTHLSQDPPFSVGPTFTAPALSA